MNSGNFDNKPKPEVFVPANLLDMIELGISITAHCRKCGHWKRLSPDGLGISLETTIPSLEGKFKCGICGSRDTCAMPEYKRPPPNGGM
jgi:hypothetical protein